MWKAGDLLLCVDDERMSDIRKGKIKNGRIYVLESCDNEGRTFLESVIYYTPSGKEQRFYWSSDRFVNISELFDEKKIALIRSVL